MNPIILEQLIRIDSAELAIACALLLAAVVATWLWIPILKGQAYRRGLAQADPTVTRALALYQGRWQARGERIDDLERDLAELRAEHARLRGWAQRGADLAAEPREREAQVLRFGRRR